MTSAGTTLAYLAFALLAVVGPGIALQHLLGLRVDRGLVLPLGLCFAAGAYWLSLVSSPWLFPAAALGLDLALLGTARGLALAPGPSLRGAIPACVGLVAFLAATQYRENRLAPDGSFRLEPLMQEDTSFHVGVAWELSHSYPPQVPGASGFPLSYQIGMPLVQAAGVRWAGVRPYDSESRFDVTLMALALLLALRAAAHALGGSPRAVALASWTVLAGGVDFLFGAPDLARWTGLLDGSFLFEVVYGRAVVPAVTLALGATVALSRYEAGEGRGWSVVASILGFAMPFFKIFMGAQFLLGLGVASLRARAWRVVAAPATLTLLGTAALALGQGYTGQTVSVALATALPSIRPFLGLPDISGLRLAAWTALWVLACLGLRMAGVPAALGSLRTRSCAVAALATLALSGWPLALLLRITFATEGPGRSVVNHAHYFLEQSGPALWVFAAVALGRLPLRAWRALAAAALGAGLAFHGTLQFGRRQRELRPIVVPPQILEAMAALEADSRPGDVVLERPAARRFPPPALVFIGRRVPFTHRISYLAHLMPPDELRARLALVQRFFRTTDAMEAAAIARSLNATHVCLYGSDEIHFDGTAILLPLYERGNARVYRLVPPEPADSRR